MRFSLLAAAALSLMVAPVIAKAKGRPEFEGKPILFHCTIKEQGNTGWVPEEVLILDDGSGGYLAIDPIVGHFIKRPVPAKLAVENSARRTFSYGIANTADSSNQYAEMAYRLTIPKNGGQVSMTGKALGYMNDYQGYGSCDAY